MNALNIQFGLTTIFILWLLVTAPMALFRFVLMPVFAPNAIIQPGILYWMLMVTGMIWQCVLSVTVLKLELGTLTKENANNGFG